MLNFYFLFFFGGATTSLIGEKSRRASLIDDDAFVTRNMPFSLLPPFSDPNNNCPPVPLSSDDRVVTPFFFSLISFSEPRCVGFFDWFGFDCFSWSCSLWAESDHGVRFWLLPMCIRLVIERKNALCWMQRKKRSILYVYIFFLLLIIALIFFSMHRLWFFFFCQVCPDYSSLGFGGSRWFYLYCKRLKCNMNSRHLVFWTFYGA